MLPLSVLNSVKERGCLIRCSSREPKQLLLHLTKRSHGCQRVHILPPLHDLSRPAPHTTTGSLRPWYTLVSRCFFQSSKNCGRQTTQDLDGTYGWRSCWLQRLVRSSQFIAI